MSRQHVKYLIKAAVAHVSPRLIAAWRYRRVAGRWPRLEAPRDLNEQILRLMLKGPNDRWTELTDKYRVRAYVASRGLADMLVPLLGHWDDPDDIDFDRLTAPYVLKSNNSTGEVEFVDVPARVDARTLRSRLRQMMVPRFAYVTAERHYLGIKPLILAERMLDPTDQQFPSTSLIDYKVLCIAGVPSLIIVYYDRDRSGGSVKVAFKTVDWQDIPDMHRPGAYYRRGHVDTPAPAQLGRLLEAAARLAEGFPLVRVDFYIVGGKIYFSEMAFTPSGGAIDYFSAASLERLGRLVPPPL